ncbi:MAG: hypothetical protein IT348_10460 [Candidatus Eisenbacteria bacterium]|nr:hypothetical protein [Candidatus Eisenbacteria bacterium]
MTIQIGDKCWTQLGKKHYGVCTGYGGDGEPWWVHNTRAGGVVHTTRKAFAGNRAIYVEQRAKPGTEALVAARALALVGRRYDMFLFNCEHAANLAANGQAESKQVQQGAVVAGLAGLLLMVVANENGTSVDSNGYRRRRGRFASRRWW